MFEAEPTTCPALLIAAALLAFRPGAVNSVMT
jgi:hypothetical protein